MDQHRQVSNPRSKVQNIRPRKRIKCLCGKRMHQHGTKMIPHHKCPRNMKQRFGQIKNGIGIDPSLMENVNHSVVTNL